jgi:hypothetical protein
VFQREEPAFLGGGLSTGAVERGHCLTVLIEESNDVRIILVDAKDQLPTPGSAAEIARRYLGISLPNGPVCRLSAHHVLHVPFVFVANILQQFGVGPKLPRKAHCPRLGIGFWIVDSELEMEVSEVTPPEALCNV